MNDKKATEIRKRNWSFITYPDSVPLDWLELLRLNGLVCVISPLHDADLHANEDEKKPHWHVIVVYDGPTSFNVVETLTKSLNAPRPIALQHVRGMYRYLTHDDNPEKVQYDKKDLVFINGFSIDDFIELSKNEVSEIKKTMTSFIRLHDILEYCDLLDYCIDNDLSNEYDVVANNTIMFDKYICSRRNKQKDIANAEINEKKKNHALKLEDLNKEIIIE